MSRRPSSDARRRASRGGRRHARGLTLLEVLVSIGILAIIGSLIYGAFDGMARSRRGLSEMNERYHHGRGAIARIAREVQAAFISMHQPLIIHQSVRTTAFVGVESRPADRLDFTSFSNRRLGRNARESDQHEVGFFAARDPNVRDKLDLVRREAKIIDLEPTKGGVVNVLAEDIESFDLRYFDPMTMEWSDSWDSTQAAAQFGRLPLYVEVTLVLRGGPRGEPIRMMTKVPLGMQMPLGFAF